MVNKLIPGLVGRFRVASEEALKKIRRDLCCKELFRDAMVAFVGLQADEFCVGVVLDGF